MTARRFKPYPAYTDTGVEWLGEIPAHWEVKRLKYFAPARISKLDVKPGDAVYVGLEHVESWTGRLLLETQPETVDSVVGFFRAGDVLFGKLRPYLAKVARPDFDGVCTSEILPLRPVAECSQSYLMYEMLNAPYIYWLDSLTYGTKMPRVSPDQVANSFLSLPPEPEQRAIAAYLDRETARIDALMAKKERLIELLQEQRTAVVTRAVTKGLDPTVPMKDSGVEWLGEIPADWSATRLKSVSTRVTKGTTPTTIGHEFSGEGIRFVKVESISEAFRVLPEACALISREADELLARSRLEEGDVLVGIAGAIGRVGLVELSLLPANTNQALGIVRLDGVTLPRWIAYCLSSDFAQEQFGLDQVQSAQANLSLSSLSNTWVSIPPARDQRAIVAFLDRKTARIDALVAKVREAIERLKELRTALISAAVTGKIDVREEVV